MKPLYSSHCDLKQQESSEQTFPTIHQMCAMGCQELDTPQHCMICPHLKLVEAHDEALDEDIVYEDLFSDILLSK